ncbi:hypothetical protein GCM10023160_30470 [Brachybacterium paraconglomeratum]
MTGNVHERALLADGHPPHRATVHRDHLGGADGAEQGDSIRHMIDQGDPLGTGHLVLAPVSTFERLRDAPPVWRSESRPGAAELAGRAKACRSAPGVPTTVQVRPLSWSEIPASPGHAGKG